VWGALHGLYLIVGRFDADLRARVAGAVGLLRHPRIHHVVQVVITFQLVSLAWLFFRATSMDQALAMLARLGDGALFARPEATDVSRLFSATRDGHLLIGGLLIALMLAVEWLASRRDADQRWASAPVWLRWPAYYALIVVILWMGDLGSRSFIYFQF
jgi:hypothetical protein